MPARKVANLFKGRKPKSLFGNASKKERQQYKSWQKPKKKQNKKNTFIQRNTESSDRRQVLFPVEITRKGLFDRNLVMRQGVKGLIRGTRKVRLSEVRGASPVDWSPHHIGKRNIMLVRTDRRKPKNGKNQKKK
ncbi:MAG: hypothetical protein Q7S21_06170 [archaeon]|nr:hypothetical protein [archaeon]